MLSNLKLAFRTLSKTPFVTAMAMLSLALGIGANTAIFSLFDQMLLRPLPVPEPGALVNLAGAAAQARLATRATRPATATAVFSYPMFRDLERVQTVFTGIAAHCLFGANLAARGQTTSARRHARVGQLLPDARAAAGARPAARRPTTIARPGRTRGGVEPRATGRRTSRESPTSSTSR